LQLRKKLAYFSQAKGLRLRATMKLKPSSNESRDLRRSATQEASDVLRALASAPHGISADEAQKRLKLYGPNVVARDSGPSALAALARHLFSPLNGLLLLLAGVSWFLSDARAAVVISAMVVLSVALAFVQEHRSNQAAAKLRAMVRTHVSLRRPALGDGDTKAEDAPMELLVPGDVVELAAGDLVPADMRVLEANNFFVNQSALTGESLPEEKFPHKLTACDDPLAADNLLFMGASVVSGYACAVALETGARTCFGTIAEDIAANKEETSFNVGVRAFTWLMIRFMAALAPAVFVINGLTKGDWSEALLFAVSVAVGLTPEMLPMIVTVNLAKGAIAISEKKVIVKRLDAIQNFGAMDVLCTDKTGTLTQDRIILKRHTDIYGEPFAGVLEYAYLNSHFQSGLRNLLDNAVLEHVELEEKLRPNHSFEKIDEIPFDFERRRLSIVVRRDDGPHLMICKGAVEEIFAISTRYETESDCGALDPSHRESALAETGALNADGFRVVAVAYKEMPAEQTIFSKDDESDLILLGYIAFLDPPKDSAAGAIADLARAGVAVKILTGDNPIVTRKICKDVGLSIDALLVGADVAAMDDAALRAAVATTTVFAKLSPPQKARVIGALRASGHVVGYLGDGVNDGPALKAADVGISVDSAADIARDSSDIILLEKSLAVLADGVAEGRKVFANILKYIRMGASSNFGNMFSVLGASVVLPFLPMTPIQVLTNNLLYDFSQTGIPTDNVDEEYLARPRKWDIGNVAKFMLFVGPVSSIFDYATFILMLAVFDAWDKPALFQTGWFVESLLTQTLIIHIIRTNRIPFVESRASGALLATTLIVCVVGVALPFSPLAPVFGFTPPPPLYWPVIAAFMIAYAVLAHHAKKWFAERWDI
jgi:P-type Mg2+ transporter